MKSKKKLKGVSLKTIIIVVVVLIVLNVVGSIVFRGRTISPTGFETIGTLGADGSWEYDEDTAGWVQDYGAPSMEDAGKDVGLWDGGWEVSIGFYPITLGDDVITVK